MKVKELIEELQKIDGNLEIIVSKDAEGNEYSPLDENYGIGYYSEENTYSGEYYSEEEVQEDILPDENITLEEFLKETQAKKCITLYPINWGGLVSMGRKKKYENAEIVKGIFSREFQYIGDTKMSLAYRFLEFKNKNDREVLKKNINEMIQIFNDALKELEE